MNHNSGSGHAAAILTILIWGTTFLSTKVLLRSFQPIEILVLRFLLGFLALLLAAPRPLRGTTRRQELTFAAAGLCGVTLYYLLENIALTYTMASNVGVMVSVSPFFTALLSQWLGKTKLTPAFFLGFACAMAGVCLLSFGGEGVSVSPLGDLLAVLAALVWACYSLLVKRIGAWGLPTIQTTRRLFAYGLLFMLPALGLFPLQWDIHRLTVPGNLGNLLFLGLGASALCFVTWNFAVKRLGAVKTSVYIYLVPVITVTASALLLGERLTVPGLVGTALTLAGLLLSQGKPAKKQVPAP